MKQRGQTSALLFSTLAMAVAFTVWAVLSPIASEIQKLYGLSATQTSILVAVPILLGSVMRIPLGIVTDQYGGRKVYTILLLFLLFPLIGLGFANSYGLLLFWAFFVGMAGTSFAVAIAYVSKWYPPERQGLALGVTGMGNIGTAIAGFTVPILAMTFGISWAFWFLTIPVLLMSILFWFSTKDLPQPPVKKTIKQQLSVIKYGNTWLLSFFYFITFGGFVAFSVYLPTLLSENFGIEPVDAGQRAAGFVVIATLARPLGGYLSDKWGAKKVLNTVFLILTLDALLIGFGLSQMFLLTVGCLIAAFFLGLGNGAVFRLVPEYFPNETGAVTGFVGAAGGLGGFFPPIVLGVILDLIGSYFLGFVLLAIFAFVGFLLNRGGQDKPDDPQTQSMKNMVSS